MIEVGDKVVRVGSEDYWSRHFDFGKEYIVYNTQKREGVNIENPNFKENSSLHEKAFLIGVRYHE